MYFQGKVTVAALLHWREGYGSKFTQILLSPHTTIIKEMLMVTLYVQNFYRSLCRTT